MGEWQLQDAKARFSEVVKRAVDEGPQTVTVRGERTAVVLSVEEYDRLTQPAVTVLDVFGSVPEVPDDIWEAIEYRDKTSPRHRMVRFLADTCLISDVRRNLAGPTTWMASTPMSQLFVSVMTLGELRRGAVKLVRRDPEGAARLDAWLDGVRATYTKRILPVSEEVALKWGELTSRRSRPLADALIAATALVHGLAVVTRNVADFADTGVVVVNPWEAA